jgi:hypothetical protein
MTARNQALFTPTAQRSIAFIWEQLHYAARVRAGFLPLTRRQVFERIKFLEITNCPFVNLPEKDAGRWGQGLTARR